MGRDVYDPPPSYATCEHCHQEFDSSGYYGSDDESHFCREKLKARLRFMAARYPRLEEILAEVRAEVAAEQRAFEEKIRREERERAEALVRAKEAELEDARRRLAELSA